MNARNFNFPRLFLSAEDVEIELRQSEDEGRDTGIYKREIKRLLRRDFNLEETQKKAEELFEDLAGLETRDEFPYAEPSELEAIKEQWPEEAVIPPLKMSDLEFEDKLRGAWLGRVCGCLLGKPVEGWRRGRLWGYLKDAYRWPLSDYFALKVPENVKAQYGLDENAPFIENIGAMPEDDDLNYTVLAMILLKDKGEDFTSEDAARLWLERLPVLSVFTAERIAYRNFTCGIAPPESARFRNPFREWIGAQIRGDFYGYVLPGQPRRAAEAAYRDARCSHVKNGIYGAMWVAAMVSAAFTSADARFIVEAGLSVVPLKSRFYESLRQVLLWRDEGAKFDDAVDRIHRLWDENSPYEWGHVIPNAMIVAAALLWGGMNYERAICGAVQACFDTDCNGATAGSVVGAAVGAGKIPQKWSFPIRDTIHTGVRGCSRLSVKELVDGTLDVIKKIYKG